MLSTQTTLRKKDPTGVRVFIRVKYEKRMFMERKKSLASKSEQRKRSNQVHRRG